MEACPVVLLPARRPHFVRKGLEPARQAPVLPQSARKLLQLVEGLQISQIDWDMLGMLPGGYDGFEDAAVVTVAGAIKHELRGRGATFGGWVGSLVQELLPQHARVLQDIAAHLETVLAAVVGTADAEEDGRGVAH
jgi:hypothetical protein